MLSDYDVDRRRGNKSVAAGLIELLLDCWSFRVTWETFHFLIGDLMCFALRCHLRLFIYLVNGSLAAVAHMQTDARQ